MKTILSLTIFLTSCANPYMERHQKLVSYYMERPIESHAVASVEPPNFTPLLREMNERDAINAQALESVMYPNQFYCY